MQIYVINGKKIYKVIRNILILLVFISSLSLLYHLFNGNIERVFFTGAVDAVGEESRVIIIDAGHGGEDSGAVGITGVLEKDLNLEIALLVGEELEKRGFCVVYTRTEDRLLYTEEENIKGIRKISDLKNRCKITESYEDPLLISLHMNSFGQSKYSGLQVYYAEGKDESLRLAREIQGAVKEAVQPDNNRVCKKGKNLYLLEHCNGTGVIIECGFLTNEEECKKLSEKEYQKQLSFAIVCGIIDYVEK